MKSKRKKSKKTIKRKKQINKMTARKKQLILDLSDMLGKIIPATSYYGRSLSFKWIAKDKNLSKYFVDKGNKKKKISNLLIKIYCYHPIIFRKILREYLPEGLDRRWHNGSPVDESEMNKINETLINLGINMKQELDQLYLNKERPAIIPPPKKLRDCLSSLEVHKLLKEKCCSLFNDGHINESARKATEIFEKYVKKLSKFEEKSGQDLMANSLNENDPKIIITNIADTDKKVHQQGFKLTAMGIMAYWRNLFSHGDEEQRTAQEAISIISIISSMIYIIEKENPNAN